MSTNIVTDTQIEQLRDEAAEAGDYVQVALCDWALGNPPRVADALIGSRWEQATRDDAREECERVIRSAQAMGD